MFRIIIIFLVTYSSIAQTKYQKDFDYYWNTVDQYFAYFDVQNVDWNEVRRIYQPSVDTIQRGDDFVRLLEMTNNELYNGHIGLNTNLASSSRLIPTGTDIWVSYDNNRFVISGIREGFPAEKSGLLLGMEVTGYNGIAISEAIKKFLPKSVTKHTVKMYEYAANLLLAGTHNTKRSINVNDSLTFNIENVKNNNATELVGSKVIGDNIGYIKINNSLGNNGTIKTFDKVLSNLQNTKGIVLDLRDTPSGGNTTVARAIIGSFISKEAPYQQHSFTYEEKLYGVKRNTIELVSPRGEIYKKPLVILCGRWTGSMGEGITIGFDGLNRAEVVGTDMGGLLGAIYNYTLPETNIGFQFPVEKLFHINGIPREDFSPKHYILDSQDQLQKAIDIINSSL
ncbi:carboxyl-terminal processing protease [Aquimarina amphilecti]|uniref:Carboxyl-terminal processing protease n=1 Tax=Aquimarina amphilecti TaxID=1038014 RepID=A0A1H7FZ27_AQUAM|nr:S41 family peptidase [Aquimarina amphilecti]SEK31353.1 carboxyl-terminal processing protease [Aquimarina amphilecti]